MSDCGDNCNHYDPVIKPETTEEYARRVADETLKDIDHETERTHIHPPQGGSGVKSPRPFPIPGSIQFHQALKYDPSVILAEIRDELGAINRALFKLIENKRSK